jgi:amphi-Trp domain-containing protein
MARIGDTSQGRVGRESKPDPSTGSLRILSDLAGKLDGRLNAGFGSRRGGEAMAERDVDRHCAKEEFVATLRRLADALERGEPFRIQVAGKRFTVPAGAELVIEHESEGGEEELAMELRWKGEA